MSGFEQHANVSYWRIADITFAGFQPASAASYREEATAPPVGGRRAACSAPHPAGCGIVAFEERIGTLARACSERNGYCAADGAGVRRVLVLAGGAARPLAPSPSSFAIRERSAL